MLGGKTMPVSGTSIKIDPQKMISVAQIIQTETSKIKQYYNSIASQSNNLKSYWEGESSNIFCIAMGQLNEQTKTITAKLDKYYSDLMSIAQEFIKDEELTVEDSQILSTDIFHV